MSFLSYVSFYLSSCQSFSFTVNDWSSNSSVYVFVGGSIVLAFQFFLCFAWLAVQIFFTVHVPSQCMLLYRSPSVGVHSVICTHGFFFLSLLLFGLVLPFSFQLCDLIRGNLSPLSLYLFLLVFQHSPMLIIPSVWQWRALARFDFFFLPPPFSLVLIHLSSPL